MAEAMLNPEKVVETVRKSASAQVDAAVKLEHKAAAGVKKAAKHTGKLAMDNPVATAGVMVGAGVVLGAVAHHLLAPKPGVGDTVMSALKGGAKRVSKKARRALK